MTTLCAKYTEIIEKHHNSITELGMHNNFEIARSHVLYVLKKIPNLGDIGEQNRRIGFVQGWMWSVGLRNIDEMRKDVMEAMNREERLDDAATPSL